MPPVGMQHLLKLRLVNAARRFANWLLTREGQLAWNRTLQGNSRRTDVPPADPKVSPTAPGEKYVQSQLEELGSQQEETRRLLDDWVRR